MNICIGIISYLPNEEKIRETRKNKLVSLINKCNELFNLPIIMVAQNWGEDISKDLPGNVSVSYFPGALGITGARNELRRLFLLDKYDYLIMLDDDCELKGTRSGADDYIKQIEDHPNMVGLFKGTLLKLFAISKEVFLNYKFDSGEPTKGEIFEDILFVNKLKLECPDKIFQFRRHFEFDEKSDNFKDPYSTWYHGQFDKHLMGDRTREIIKKYGK